MEISYPTWREDPTPVLAFVRSYLDADEKQSPHVQQARLVAERKELTEQVLARVARSPSGRFLVSPIFKWILDQTQTHTRERDTMHFELTRMFPPFRKMLLELGRRWRERDLIFELEDIFFLKLEEIIEIAAEPRPMKETIASRRAEYETNRTRPWPNIIRGKQEIYAGEGEAAEISGDTLKGVPGSPGLVTGVSRIIRGPEEFAKLQKGDILVAPLTNPVWTPLFALAGGVITEVGGILSHGAIVAREYGIPAVMSVAGATRHVPEGQPIRVDGSRGLVQLDVEAVAMRILLLILVCYLLGSLPVAWLVTKLVSGQDLRLMGSGNVGVMNTAISVARWAGLLVFLGEASKGMLAVLLARALGGGEIFLGAAVIATVVGTRWSIWLGGAGGRGNTAGAGALLLIAWPAIPAGAAAWALARVLTRSSFWATRACLVLAPFILGANHPILVVCGLWVYPEWYLPEHPEPGNR